MINNMVVISIIIKDLKTILSDKKTLSLIIFMPIILMTILSFALKDSFSSGDVSDKVNIAVVKRYDKNLESQLFKETLNNNYFKNEMGDQLIDTSDRIDPENIFFREFLNSNKVSKIVGYSIEEENTAMELLDNGKVSAVVVLPKKFIFDMKMNLLTPFRNKVDIRVITHPDRNIDGQIIKSVVEAYKSAMSAVIIGKNALIETSLAYGLEGDTLNDINDVMIGMEEAIEEINIDVEKVTVVGRKSISSADYYAVAMICMFILYAASNGGRMLLEEKENITLQRMTIAGVSKNKILVGKYLTIFLIALIQIAVMIAFSHFALKVQWGNLYLIIFISITAAFAVAGIGAFIAAATYRSNNYKMSNIFQTAVIQGMALIGGSYIPVDSMPNIIQKLSFLSINGIALKAYLKVMVGFTLDEVINYIVALAGVGILFIMLATLIFKEKEGGISDKHNKIKTVKAQG